MRVFPLLVSFVACVAATSLQAYAGPVGPTYPAPGGNSFSSNGVSGSNGTAIWNYSSFNVTGLDGLWFGLNQLNVGGPVGAGLNGAADPFTSVSVIGQTATYSGSTTWLNPTTLNTVSAGTRLIMTVTGLGATPWTTNLASMGLDDTGTYGFLGAVVDNSVGSNFTLSWQIQANTGSGWQAINSVLQHASHTGYTRSNFSTGFYYDQAEPVPEPSSLILLTMGGLTGLGYRLRRRTNA